MKLDNKGWGLSTLLICFCIILFFLIISVYYAHTFSNGSTTLLGLSELKQLGFTENIIDKVTKNECSGYVIIKNINNVMDINSYLKCDNYITEGYNG